MKFKNRIFLILISSFFLSLLIFIFQSNAILSADNNNSLQKYNDNFDEYRKAYQEYIQSKNTYLTYKTLISQNEALDKTKKLLEIRDDVLISYYNLLKEKINQTEGITPFEQTLKGNTIDTRIKFLEDHKMTISPIASLDDIVNKSKEIDKISQEINIEADKTIGAILVGKVRNNSDFLYKDLLEIKQIISDIKSSGKDVTKLERWTLDINTKYQLAVSKLDEAKSLFESLSQNEIYKEKQDFAKAKKLTTEAHQYIKEANFNAKEIINEIKYGPY